MRLRKTTTFTYNLVRMTRKTMALKVEEDGTITVRAPYRISLRDADLFVEKHREWILKRQSALRERQEKRRTYTEQERAAGKRNARSLIEEKCRYYGRVMGVDYERISIREQKTRWGSCSSKGNLNFNWKLILMPEEILDYVVVHELAHRKEMNHSPAFWKIVGRVIPDYPERRAWLKAHGAEY